MGLYIYVTEAERKAMRSVSDPELNIDFQEALKIFPYLLIEERIVIVKNGFFSKPKQIMVYTVYHDHPDSFGNPYQARQQLSACGDKRIVTAYLHGIFNGGNHGIIEGYRRAVKDYSSEKEKTS